MTARSNRYVLLIGDYYTKWVEAVAIPNQKAKTVARALLDEFICRFGAPAFLHTNQGRNFERSLFRELCSLLNIQKTRTTAYHPESDGFMERFNRTLENMLSMYVEDNQTDWDLHLQSVMLAYRSTIQDTTGYTPHFLMAGREINFPIDVMFLYPTRVYCPSPTDTAIGIRAGQKKYAELSEATEGVLRPSGTRISVQRRRPSVVACSLREAWQNSQLWPGSYTVIKELSDVTNRIQQSGNGRRRRQVVHFNRIKPYSEPSERDSQDVQRLDTDRETGDQIAPPNRLLTAEWTIPDADGVQAGSVIDATAELYENDNDLGDNPPETDCVPVSPPNPLVGPQPQEDALIPDDVGAQQPTHTADGHLPNAVTPYIP